MIYLRDNTKLKCTTSHHCGSLLIEAGSHAFIYESDRYSYNINVKTEGDNNFRYIMPKQNFSTFWEIDLYNELIDKGMSGIYISKINIINNFSRLIPQYLKLQESGVKGPLFIKQVQMLIDATIMEQSLA